VLADEIHRRAQHTLRATTGATVAGMLAQITLERSPQIRDWYAAGTARLVAGGQRAAGTLAVAYIRAILPLVAPVDLDAALALVLMTSESPGAFVGLLRLWRLLDEGLDELRAREQAGSYAATLAMGNMNAAQRAGLGEGARATGRAVKWRKVAAPGACEWCQLIASGGARYSEPGRVPFHTFGRDRCGVAPEFAAAT
jgi:hypothetical protein